MGNEPLDDNGKRDDSRKYRCYVLVIVMAVIVIIIAGFAVTAKDNPDNPFLTYPLQVEQFEVQQNSNDTYKFIAWVENQDYSSSHEGQVHCTVFFSDDEGERYPDASYSFSSDVITVGPGERSMIVVWSGGNPFSTDQTYIYQTYRCQIVQ